MSHPATEELVAGYGETQLPRPETLRRRLRLPRLATGVTTLAYWVGQQRHGEAEQAWRSCGSTSPGLSA